MELNEIRKQAGELSDLLKTMAHPERLMVLYQLIEGEVGAGKLQERSTLSQSAFSQHLRVLRKHHLVKARKESQAVFYTLADKRTEAFITSFYKLFYD